MCIPHNKPAEEVRRGIGRLLRVGGEEAQARELVDGGVLEQAKLRICDTGPGDHLHIHLNPLTWVGQLLVRLRFVRFFTFLVAQGATAPLGRLLWSSGCRSEREGIALVYSINNLRKL